ncbi:MAG: hypothetical protein ABII06_10860 [Pseudomonadota bacterium]
MNQKHIVNKLKEIVFIGVELKKTVSGDPALEGDIDRILAIAGEKWLLLDPESFMAYRKDAGM